MISSKKITQLSYVLVAIAVVFVIVAMLLPSSNRIGTVTYSDAHTVSFAENDYYTTYAEGGVSKITMNGVTATAKSNSVLVDGNEITILGGGVYVLSGTLDGNIIVDSEDGAEVRLVLNGATVKSPDFAPLYVKQAEKVVLSLVYGTENCFEDGDVYGEEKLEDGKATAAIYSKDDLVINGGGSLTVIGNYQDGIKANDTFKMTEGTLSVTAKDDGINANDYIAFLDVDVTIDAGNDAVKCENEGEKYGFISFDGTRLTAMGGDDGIYASSGVYIAEGEMDILAGGDALHAGGNLLIDVKRLNITKCNEGIEAANITINGGDINIVSRDDAINAVGENLNGGFGRMPMGGAEKTEDEDIYLTINGGNIRIETLGDGIDSNGSAVINGGRIEVYGPENSGNGSIDVGDGGYVLLMNGGTLLAAGSSGMAETPSASSLQNSIEFLLNKTYQSGDVITLADKDGNEILSGTSGKKFGWVCISSPDIATGGSYTLKINGEEIMAADITKTVTSVGNNGRRRW